MKIVCITNLFPDTTRPGFASFNRQQLISISSIHKVSVIVPVPWTHMLGALLRGKKPAVLDDCRHMRVEFPVYFYTPRFLRDLYWRYYMMSIGRVFRRVVREEAPDLVYGTWAYPDCRAAAELARRHGLPFVMRIHGSDINDFFRYGGRKRLILEAMEMSEAVISVNRDLAEKLSGQGVDRNRISVVYNGIDRTIFVPSDKVRARSGLGIDPGARVILFAGNLKPVKGVDILLEAFASSGVENGQLHIIGDGPLENKLKKAAESLGCEDTVFFHGRVRHTDMARWYSACDLFCLPSLSEGTPNVILEALACGIPVVASNTGGIPEVVSGDSGILFETGSSESLREAIREGLSRDWDRNRIDCPAGTWLKNAQIVSDVFERASRAFRDRGSGTQHAK